MSMEGKLSRAMEKARQARSAPAAADDSEQKTGPVQTAARVAQAERRKPQAIEIEKAPHRCMEFAAEAVMAHVPHGEVAAQIRALRGRILAFNNGNPPRVIAISSGSRTEGKTTVAFNLALALSEINAGRVILVDGDMLRPNLHVLAGLDIGEGLSDILNGSLSLDRRIYGTPVENLDLIPTRAVSISQESESPLHRNVEPFLKELRRHYAFVIIDTPPVMAGSHAGVFGKHADGCVIVARMEKTSRHVVKRAIEEMSKTGAKVIGCVLTHQKHHVPDFIYRFFGTTSSHYYRYAAMTAERKTAGSKASGHDTLQSAGEQGGAERAEN